MLKEKLEKVIEHWQKEKLELSPPHSKQQVSNCFRLIERSVSRDILELYSSCGGTSNGKMSELLFSLWTLEEIEKENSAVSELTYFADFLIESHRYAFKYESEDISSVYSNCKTPDFVKIADSVEQLFGLYLINPNEIGL